MANPQQPELRRSGKVAALDPDAAETALSVQDRPTPKGRTGKVPEEQQPGHHPDEEQDKPDLDKFAERLGIVPEGEEPEDAPRVEDDAAPRARRAGARKPSTVSKLADAPSRQRAQQAETARSTAPRSAPTQTAPAWSPIGLALVGPVTGLLIAKRVLQVLTRRGR